MSEEEFQLRCTAVKVDNKLESTIQKIWNDVVKVGKISFVRDEHKKSKKQKSLFVNGLETEVHDDIKIVEDADDYFESTKD